VAARGSAGVRSWGGGGGGGGGGGRMRCATRGVIFTVVAALYSLFRVFSSEQSTITQLREQNEELHQQVWLLSRAAEHSKQHEAQPSPAPASGSDADVPAQQDAQPVARQTVAHPEDPPVNDSVALTMVKSSSCLTNDDRDFPGWDVTQVALAHPTPGLCCDACEANTKCAARPLSPACVLHVDLT
jgi:hypothetical protein